MKLVKVFYSIVFSFMGIYIIIFIKYHVFLPIILPPIPFNLSSSISITYLNEINASHYVRDFFTWPNHSLLPKGSYLRRFSWGESSDDTLTFCKLKELPQLEAPRRQRDLNAEDYNPKFRTPYLGGIWTPSDCSPLDSVAILVPFRDRWEHLEIFVRYMHSFLQRQGIDYGLYIIEQTDQRDFNRAKLFNVGFVMSQLMHNYTCYILHDVDHLPEDTRFLYRCSVRPTHMVAHIHRSYNPRYTSGHLYETFFGGVSSVLRDQYIAINGMINDYWKWGAEDDELYMRLKAKGFSPTVTTDKNAKYLLLVHRFSKKKSGRLMPLLDEVSSYMNRNGLNTLRFNLSIIKYLPLYTYIGVEL